MKRGKDGGKAIMKNMQDRVDPDFTRRGRGMPPPTTTNESTGSTRHVWYVIQVHMVIHSIPPNYFRHLHRNI